MNNSNPGRTRESSAWDQRASGRRRHKLLRGKARLHVAEVIVQWLDRDLGLAHCSDVHGSRYTIDCRSAVSISALHEGLPLTVEATAGGVVKFLVWDERDRPARRPARAGTARDAPSGVEA
jgi:hypothetical protein